MRHESDEMIKEMPESFQTIKEARLWHNLLYRRTKHLSEPELLPLIPLLPRGAVRKVLTIAFQPVKKQRRLLLKQTKLPHHKLMRRYKVRMSMLLSG
jgi:hypothetical protein